MAHETHSIDRTCRLTYAVGDVHGRLDLLLDALDAIEAHAAGTSFRIVFLGDYVDRGPDSRGVVDLLIDLQKRRQVVCLKGNHEELMCRALVEPGRGNKERWLENGGKQTLLSYGLAWSGYAAPRIPTTHFRWLTGLPLTTGDTHRIYVHAGLLPRTPVHQQSEDTLLWVRDRFFAGGVGDFEAHVVHGHTPIWKGKPDASEPELLAHRTNLDTGAFATGVLSVGVFDAKLAGGPREVLRISGSRSKQDSSVQFEERRVLERMFD
jgi:serine/threonine protein phosphatase 1